MTTGLVNTHIDLSFANLDTTEASANKKGECWGNTNGTLSTTFTKEDYYS